MQAKDYTSVPRVYVAGKLNDDAVKYLQHVHRMITWAVRVQRAGFSVYAPCLDLLTGLVCGNFGYNDFFDNSQPWLAASAAVFVCPGWETSDGTRREIEYATSIGIPVFYTLWELRKWRDQLAQKATN